MRKKALAIFSATAVTGLLTLTASIGVAADAPRCARVFSIEKGHPFVNLEYGKTAYAKAIPASAWTGSLQQRKAQFLKKYPDHSRVVSDVYFKHVQAGEIPMVGTRDVLLISTKNAPGELINDYINMISYGTVSFPLGRGGGHLYTRFGNKTVDFHIGVREKDYLAPGSHRIETVVQLSPTQFSNMGRYLLNATSDAEKTVGPFVYKGSQQSKGLLDNNTCAGGHNCTSWMATSGVGEKGQRLMELTGAKLDVEIGTNPGWWSLWLNTHAPKDIVPFTVFFTPHDLPYALQNEVKSFRQIITTNEVSILDPASPSGVRVETVTLPWDFSPH